MHHVFIAATLSMTRRSPCWLFVLLLPAAGGFHSSAAVCRAAAAAARSHGDPRCSAVPPPPLPAAQAIQSTLGEWLERSRGIRCPFWRTRATDAVDALLTCAEFVAARHKSILDRQWLPGSEASLFEPLSLPVPSMGAKTRHLPLEAVIDVVRRDFEHGQYYVSGKLSQAVYNDACFFDGPDPDMPVKSLQRYSDALKGLFDPHRSAIELVSIEPRPDERGFIAHWRLSGALKLPGRPRIKPYAGATRYELDEEGLILSHTETWSIGALDAFLSTAWPAFGAPAAPPVTDHVFVEPPPCRLPSEAAS